MGKSSLLKLFVRSLSRNLFNPIYLSLTHVGASGFLKLLVSSLGELPRRGKERLFLQILDRLQGSEHTTLLVIDDAHLLPSEALTDLRLLISSGLEDGPPLKIILSGQEVLRDELRRAPRSELGRYGADLLVIGAHRGPSLEAKILGTTADRLIRAAEVPCLIVRHEVPIPARLIGVPIDDLRVHILDSALRPVAAGAIGIVSKAGSFDTLLAAVEQAVAAGTLLINGQHRHRVRMPGIAQLAERNYPNLRIVPHTDLSRLRDEIIASVGGTATSKGEVPSASVRAAIVWHTATVASTSWIRRYRSAPRR